jgi:hypothetical protein
VGLKRLMCYATFNNVSVIHHTFAIGRGLRRLMFYATFNNVSVIYHTCTVGSLLNPSVYSTDVVND